MGFCDNTFFSPDVPPIVDSEAFCVSFTVHFVQALQKLDDRLDSEKTAPQHAALVDYLAKLSRLYLAALNDATPSINAQVHESLATYAASSAAFAAATAGQLVYECRILRHALLLAAREMSCISMDALATAHGMVDACLAYIVHRFVHEEELLRQSRAQFSLVIDAIPQLVWRTTIDGEATFANKRFLEHVGCSLEEVLGWGWLSYVHPDDQPQVAKEWSRCRDAQMPVSVMFRVRGCDGTYRWFLSLGNPFRDSSNTLVAYYGTWTDVDDHKRIEAKLQQAVQARDTFLSIASHELKTPLTALKLQVQMRSRAIQRGGTQSIPVGAMQKMLEQDGLQISRITRLVNDMLDVARLDSNKLTLALETVDLSALVRDVVDRQRPILDAAGCAVNLTCEEGVVGQWDPLRIEQVLSNLLVNSCRYAAHAAVDVLVNKIDSRARIIVADRGPGIAPQDHERVFGRFERAISANERSGLGLGLYIARQIVEMHHGQIALESQLGKGSTFTIEMPR